ncbi:MAG: SGNH/GDSL hydrolase family protein [Acidothermales bacterium]|nr:SGNH/GDSL hydrolase family protein [Acidothermales bacterium]
MAVVRFVLRSPRPRRRVLAFLAAVAALVVPSLVGGSQAQAAPSFSHYVALGDSYTSGPFIPWPRFDPVGCGRSTNDYPALFAGLLKIGSYTDASCSGAQTSNMTQSQSVPLGSNGPQFDALTADTDLVTLGIGGNDFDLFSSLIDTCSSLYESDPNGSPCRDKYVVNGQNTLQPDIDQIGLRVGGVLAGIHQRSPRATVLTFGYPHIVPTDKTCQSVLPFSKGDYPFLDSVERALDTAIANAAAGGTARYVDTYAASAGHDACEGSRAWINGQHLNVFAAAPYHPFESGMVGSSAAGYATLTGQQVTASTLARAGRLASERRARAGAAGPAHVQRLAEAWDVRNGQAVTGGAVPKVFTP